MTTKAYATKRAGLKPQEIDFEVFLDEELRPIDRLLEMVTIDGGYEVWNFAEILRPLLREFVRGYKEALAGVEKHLGAVILKMESENVGAHDNGYYQYKVTGARLETDEEEGKS